MISVTNPSMFRNVRGLKSTHVPSIAAAAAAAAARSPAPSAMFSLMYGFWQLLFRKSEWHILILGLDYAGKTVRAHARHTPHASLSHTPIRNACVVSQSVLERLKAIFSGVEPLPPGRIPPTVGLNIGRIRVQRQQLLFWDLGGGGSLRALWTK